jgi:hypothetical protein
MNMTLSLRGWCGWAAGLTTPDQWRAWLAGDAAPQDATDKPACKTIPAMMRRRCTLNSRMFLESALQLCAENEVEPGKVALMFGSANGEIQVLKKIQESLCANEPFSPTAFTNSVHHTPTGYFAIATQNKGVSRTLSAFDDTFVCAYLDMTAMLSRRENGPVLLVLADELLLEPFDQMLEPPPFPYAIAMLFEKVAPDAPGLRFSRIGSAPDTKAEPLELREPVFHFLRWYESGSPRFTLPSGFGEVAWQRT